MPDVIGKPRIFADGVYEPLATNIANVVSFTEQSCQYARVGSTVTVSGGISDIITTADADTETSLRITLPVTSDLTTVYECSGVGVFHTGAQKGNVAAVVGNVADGEAEIRWLNKSTSSSALSFNFTYRIV